MYTEILVRIWSKSVLMAKLCGSGLRLMECLHLCEDLDFGNHQIIVRDGKGEKDHVTVLPEAFIPTLQTHLQTVQAIHHPDLRKGIGAVSLP